MTDISNFDSAAKNSQALPAVRTSIYAAFGKRVFDLFIVLISAPILVPVIAVLWFVVRRDGGSGFFSHKRVGKDGREFPCHKIRTMVVDAEAQLETYLEAHPEEREVWNREFKLKNDPRITPIGRVLRATSLDELPQFFNVLRGEMSFVGPRPVPRKELAMYGTQVGYYEAVRPGVTGLWQVSGRNDISYDERIDLDRQYAQTHSFKNDVVILARTFKAVLGKTGY